MKTMTSLAAGCLMLSTVGCFGTVFLANFDGQPINIEILVDGEVESTVEFPAFDGDFTKALDNPVLLETGTYTFRATTPQGEPLADGECELTVEAGSQLFVAWALGELRCGELSELQALVP